MRNHTTNGLVEDSGWGTEMERTYFKSDQAPKFTGSVNARKISYLLGLGCIGSSCGGRRGTLL